MFKKLVKASFSFDLLAIIALVIWTLIPLTWPLSMPGVYWLKQLLENGMYGVAYFVNAYFLLPKLLTRSKLVLYILSIFALIYVIVMLNAWMQDSLHMDDVMAKAFSTTEHPYSPDHHLRAKWTIFMCVVILGLSSVSSVSKKFQAHQLAMQVADNDRIRAELSFLKAQINPHFFFNTLHTIYALTDSDPGKAKDSLYTLSHMMRYVIYDTKNDAASIRKEIKFLEDYIHLMRMRIDSGVDVNFTVDANIKDVEIAPMLLLPFVENAFKHGISALQASFINIEMRKEGPMLKFVVQNSVFKNPGAQLTEEDGIGISNTKRRLDLLYPGKYHLTVTDDEQTNQYIAILTLEVYDN